MYFAFFGDSHQFFCHAVAAAGLCFQNGRTSGFTVQACFQNAFICIVDTEVRVDLSGSSFAQSQMFMTLAETQFFGGDGTAYGD